jgi:NLR family CARD domain-containing protein 3
LNESIFSLDRDQRYHDEFEEEDKEIARDFFDKLDLDGSRSLSSSEFHNAIQQYTQQHEKELAAALQTMMDKSKSAGQDINFEDFYKAVRELPRVRGQRVQWVRTLGLDWELARLLKKGDFFDGLRGLREMTDEDLMHVCSKFSQKLHELLKFNLDKLKKVMHMHAENYKNAKFAMDGSFEGSFAELKDFYDGPEKLIGTPNPNAQEGVRREHCDRGNSNKEYKSPNYNFEFTPKVEYEFVVDPKQGFAYGHTPVDRSRWPLEKKDQWTGEQGREIRSLEGIMQHELVQAAGLQKPEVICLRLYTGPLYILYNSVMRKHPKEVYESLQGNQYETTIFCIMSGIIKLSKAAQVPPGRRVFRGLGGMILPEEFWRMKKGGFRGGVEWGLMSTTTNQNVAMQYSGVKQQRGTVFEISVGRVDMGADISWLSQYPKEEEILFPPLTCLEVVGEPRVEENVIVFPLSANMNLKGLTLEQLVERRKQLHLAMAKNLGEELFIESSKALSDDTQVSISKMVMLLLAS